MSQMVPWQTEAGKVYDERSPEQLDMLPVLKSQYSVLLAMLLFSEAVLSWKSL